MSFEPSVSPATETLHARAILVGRHLDLRQLTHIEPLEHSPLTIRVGASGRAVLLRYGAIVLFDVEPTEESTFIANLLPLVREPLETPKIEELRFAIEPAPTEAPEPTRLTLPDSDVSRLQVIADVMGKSVLLDDQEAQVSRAFDRIEPLASELQRLGRGARNARELVRHIGEALEIQGRMVGRGEVGDKPDTIWERPDLERLYLALESELEIRERQIVLERKLTLISNTAGTLLDLLHTKRSLRVEWYIVALIVVEIALTLYEMFLKGHLG